MRRLPLLLLPLALFYCHRSQSSATLPQVRIAIHRDPIAFLPVRVAQTLGYYEAEGIAVALSEVAGGAKALEALLGGSVDVAAASMSDAMQIAAEGRDVRGFLVLYTRPSAALAVAPALNGTIRTIRDLKGRTVGVSTPGSSTHQLLNFLLVRDGLSPADVSTVSVGMSASSVAALEHGTVDAAVLLGSAVAAFEERHPSTTFIVDIRTAGRGPAGVRLRDVSRSEYGGAGQLAPVQSRDRPAARASSEARHALGTRSPGGAGSGHDSRCRANERKG